MPTQPERLRQIRGAVARRGGIRKVALRALYGVAAWLVLYLIDKAADGILSERVWPWIVDRFWILVHQPIGIIGLLFIVYLAALMTSLLVMAWWETRPRVARTEADKRALEQQVAELRKERDHFSGQANGWFQKVNYGKPFPQFGPLGEHDRLVAVNQAIELTDRLQEAMQPADRVWNGGLHAWAVIDHTSSWIFDRLHGEEYRQLQAASIALARNVRTSSDPRPLLAVAYMAYHRWRASVVWLDRLHSIRSSADYQAWYEADRKFEEHIERLMNTNQLAEVKRTVEDWHREEGAEVALLPPQD